MNFFELIKRVNNMKWSTNDPEPKVFGDILMSSKIAFQQAMIELWNAYPFPFKKCQDYKVLNPGENTISAPFGTVLSIVSDNGCFLKQVRACQTFDDKKGVPTCYKIETDNAGDRIVFYPTPAAKCGVQINYHTMHMAVSVDDESKFNMTDAQDRIAISHPIYLKLFENAVILLTQCYLIQDANDENFAPYREAYQRALYMLINYCANSMEKRIVI
ncbi:MAG: hypothetical protein LBU87_03710 [Lactobacillales bacterium]|jgi:hypothetical protein|nr:hypothetical protein [Lactobacillales bacterium]